MKSPAKVILTALGASPWIPLDYIQHPFQVTMAGLLSSGAALTWGVQYTYDEISFDQAQQDITIARVGTTATVTWANHDMVTSDSVIVQQSGSSVLDSQTDASGRPISSDITVVDLNTFTYTVANSGAAASNGFAKGMRLRVFPHATLTAQTARADSNFNLPCKALRFIITAYTSGRLIGLVTQGGPP